MLRRLLPFFTVLVLTLAAAFSSAHAQSVRWSPDSGTLAANQLSELNLVFDDCEPKDTLTIPAVPNLSISPQPNRSESNSFTVINGKASRTRTVTLTFRVRPTGTDPINIPSFKVETDKGAQLIGSASFTIGNATVGQSSISLESVAQSRFTLPPDSLWVGEVFPLTYSLNVARRYFYQLGSEPDWNSAPLSVEPWTKPELLETTVNNEARVSILYKTRAYAKSPGTFPLHNVTQLVNLATGSSSFSVFARANLEQFSITSQPASLTVKPLPLPAPVGFNGAVGQFKLTSQLVPATATVGEPVTWTLTLEGTGNWPDIPGLPARSVSKDFRIVQPQAKRVNKNDALYEASITEDIVLIPSKPGTYTLGPVTYTFFNPGTGVYEILKTQPATLTVSAGATPPASSSGHPATVTPASSDLNLKLPTSTDAVSAPGGSIPRDPLPPGGSVLTPLSRPALLGALLSAILLPLAVWTVLALRRARVTDPGLSRREAHIRLADTLRQLSASDLDLNLSSSSGRVIALVQRWQADTAILWGFTQAVPTADSFTQSPSAQDPAVAAAWAELWLDADRTLYGATPLPAGWLDRAHQALTARRAPTFSPVQLFHPRNLFPFFVTALLLSLFTLPPSVIAAASPEAASAAYNKGDFAAATTAWTDALKVDSTDWTAHHNLALALIQQNRANEAAGHAVAAFVQQPQNPSVRWHLDYVLKTAGVTPVALKPFLSDAPVATLARLASPARWQFLLISSAWLTGLALALGLYGAYQKRPRRWLSGSLLAVSLIIGTAAGLSLNAYGPLADSRAVMVVTSTTLRSIPTELDTPQKSTPLSIGVIATTDKTLLGWTRLSFPDGQTGWTRTETLVPLW